MKKVGPSDTSLFGWPAAAGEAAEGLIEVIGVPSDVGNSIASGARFGPEAIRRASFNLRPGAFGIDHGNIGDGCICDLEQVLEQVDNFASAIIQRKSSLIMLGGDHSISYAAIAAAARECSPLNIVWFDAHTDFCPWPNQRWHSHSQVLRRIANLGNVGRIVQIGHRGMTYFDEAERFDRLKVVRSSQAQMSCIDAVLEQLPSDEPIYISIDIDVVDPTLAPGTGHPVPGGLSIVDVSALAHAIGSARKVVGIDVVEVNPLLDLMNITSAAAATIISNIVPILNTASMPFNIPAAATELN